MDSLAGLSLEEIEELMRSDTGMQLLIGPHREPTARQVHIPKFSELVAAVPGRMTDVQFAKVLSGGTPLQWGPWRRLAEKLMARQKKE
ncbi:hypothetical protein DFR24_4356 [Panacagrimonas perspica]|uniref:Uncharacterized protein n=2 Tax=Panacagrimonas perspica TaxID=381431 RepID=A0A4R7NZB6_9GAMM|nr:hypothetical protein DFR24_4356 [Panacagrimonas perspica]